MGRQIASELGVRYVLEGGVQKAGNHVRVNAQLIDGETGAHLWAERYDRDSADFLRMQDEITNQIANALDLTLTQSESDRSWRDHPTNPELSRSHPAGKRIIERARIARNKRKCAATLRAGG